jgi:3-phenylpropionate/trans-cinnamate dioxygenase ferredoxin subunit
MAKHIVGTIDEIPVGGRKIVEIAGRSLGVFNVGGEYFALRNRCPHQGGPLCVGQLTGFITSSTPGEYEYSRKGEIVRCPWHGWEFDIRTGQSWFDPAKVRVRRYEVKVEPGTALAEPDAPAPGLERGPYTAETYPVSIEQHYLVVDLPGN